MPSQDHLPIVADCLLPAAPKPLAKPSEPSEPAELSVACLGGEDETPAGSGFARGPGVAALIWAGILSVQLLTGLLSASSPPLAFINLRGKVDDATAVVSARNPISVVLMLVTEGSKLAVLLWAVATALRRRGASRAVVHSSLDGATDVAEEATVGPSRNRLGEVEQQAAKADVAATEHLGTEV
jgi:hypothetical protein